MPREPTAIARDLDTEGVPKALAAHAKSCG